MTTFDTLLERNQGFASHEFSQDLPLMSMKAMIIGCVDQRVDPAHVLGLKPGEAVVIRNVGGRITPATLQTMGMLGRIAQAEGGLPSSEFHLIVLQHTQCGIRHLEGNPEMLASYFGIGQEELSGKAVDSPHAAVAVDVATLKAIPTLPGSWLVSGLVYDVATGLVEVVVPPAPLRHAESHG